MGFERRSPERCFPHHFFRDVVVRSFRTWLTRGTRSASTVGTTEDGKTVSEIGLAIKSGRKSIWLLLRTKKFLVHPQGLLRRLRGL